MVGAVTGLNFLFVLRKGRRRYLRPSSPVSGKSRGSTVDGLDGSRAQAATDPKGTGQENFNTLATLAEAYAANGKTAEAKATRDKALHHPTATAIDIHQFARQLMASGKKDDALEVFQLNAKLHPDTWPVNWGLARGYAALGKYPDALKYAKMALPQAPDEANKKNVEGAIQKLAQGLDIN